MYLNNQIMIEKFLRVGPSKLLLLILVLNFLILVTKPINLITADLGRHIENGRILINGHLNQKLAVLNTNYYSYTQPHQEFLNHHWGSGVIFYIIYVFFGFTGTAFFYSTVLTVSFLLSIYLSIKKSGYLLTLLIASIMLPLITSRSEIRPEAFTYLFTNLFFLILWETDSKKSCYGKVKIRNIVKEIDKKLWLLPLLMLFWVNLHIGFLFGFLLVCAYAFKELVNYLLKKDNNFYQLIVIGVLTFICGAVNPFFLEGLAAPLKIFENYGYLVVENQSINFLENLGFYINPNLSFFKIISLFLFLSLITFVTVSMAAKVTKDSAFLSKFDTTLLNNLILLIFFFISFNGIRHFPSFGFLAIPILATNIKYVCTFISTIFPKNIYKNIAQISFLSIMLLFTLSTVWQFQNHKNEFAILDFGLKKNVSNAGDFFTLKKIHGPIFNNYDIGGYLIYYLNKNKKVNSLNRQVFVDNRPEAYTVDFFQNTYIPMQSDDSKWMKLDKIYNFNTIVFSHNDYTPWGQNFLKNRINDKNWSVVYYDEHAIIFLKNNEKNKVLISRYEISKNIFSFQ